MQRLLLFALVFLLSSCAEDAPLDFQPDRTAVKAEEPVNTEKKKPEGILLAETGHKKTAVRQKKTLAFDLKWSDRAAARFTQRIDGAALHIQYASGTQAWWDSRNVWLLPVEGDTISLQQARFDLRAWHYFSCLPYKLSDPGVYWQTMPDRTLDGRVCVVGRLTFQPGTGDTPNDWFAVFTDKKERLVRGAAYVATFGQVSVEVAAKTPQMIQYLNYKPVDGVPFAHKWLFTGWQTETLEGGVVKGNATISNAQFGVDDAILSVPAAAIKM